MKRGRLIDQLLKTLEYDFDAVAETGTENCPGIGFLLLDYLFEEKRSVVTELERRAQKPAKNVAEAYRRQQEDDLKYARHKGTEPDVDFVNDRWDFKIDRAKAGKLYEPNRLQSALATGRKDIKDDFFAAREFENLFAYARRDRGRYYFTGNKFDAPMHADVLQEKSLADVKRYD